MFDRPTARDRFVAVRARTEALAAWLSPEDQMLQAFAEASPTKWHRAHTTWFFEQFALSSSGDERAYLWNSYYDSVGPRHPRAERGLLSRPSCAEVSAWRAVVDDRILAVIDRADDDAWRAVAPVLALGCHHEEQHQELILTDILAAFVLNPAGPRLRPGPAPTTTKTATKTAKTAKTQAELVCDGGLVDVGFTGSGFCFDNELPRHKVFVQPFALGSDVVSIGDCRAFVDDGGYQRPSLWLAAGFAQVQQQRLSHPHRVRVVDGVWQGFGVDGWRVLDDDEPAAFLSFYEADALARFLGGRLPTECEWELACGPRLSVDAGFDVPPQSSLRPRAGHPAGEVWEWTSSAYSAYPGFAADPGALGEYNGKFMVGQQVLRGGSAFTPRGHARASYRNFWPAETRFQLTGARVARDR